MKRKVKHLAGIRKHPCDNYVCVFLVLECPQRVDLSSNAKRDRWISLLETSHGNSRERKRGSERNTELEEGFGLYLTSLSIHPFFCSHLSFPGLQGAGADPS